MHIRSQFHQWGLLGCMALGLLAGCRKPPSASPDAATRLMLLPQPKMPLSALTTRSFVQPAWNMQVPTGTGWTETQSALGWEWTQASTGVVVHIQQVDNIPLDQAPDTVLQNEPEPPPTAAQLAALEPEQRERWALQEWLQKTQSPIPNTMTVRSEAMRTYVLGVVTALKRQHPTYALNRWAIGWVNKTPAAVLDSTLSPGHASRHYVLFAKNHAIGLWVHGTVAHLTHIHQWADGLASSFEAP